MRRWPLPARLNHGRNLAVFAVGSWPGKEGEYLFFFFPFFYFFLGGLKVSGWGLLFFCIWKYFRFFYPSSFLWFLRKFLFHGFYLLFIALCLLEFFLLIRSIWILRSSCLSRASFACPSSSLPPPSCLFFFFLLLYALNQDQKPKSQLILKVLYFIPRGRLSTCASAYVYVYHMFF